MNKYIESLKAQLKEKGVEEALIEEAIKGIQVDDNMVNLTQEELTEMMDEVAQKTLDKAGLNEIKNSLETISDKEAHEKAPYGFKGLYDFCSAVRNNATGNRDDRLYSDAYAKYNTFNKIKTLDTVEPGEFIIPEDFSTQILSTILEDPGFFGRMTNFPVTGNSFKTPFWVDKDHTDGNLFGGMQVYYEEEGKSTTESDLKFGKLQLDLHKLFGYITVTSELLEDSPFAMDVLLRDKFSQVLNYRLNDACINGTGAGQILGLLNSPSLVTVAKESAQSADTIVAANLYKMYAHLYGASVRNAMWLISGTLIPQLMALTQGNYPIWLPNNNIANAPFGTILGIPVMRTEFCKKIGDKGDIFLVDWSQYISITKQGATPNFASSMHIKFDEDKTAYRITFRHDAQPWWEAPITPKESGDFQTSPFVTLAERT